MQLKKFLADKNHVFSKFGTGNLETLSKEPKEKGIDVRKELIAFHDKYYSANTMKLVILGKEEIPQLEKWVFFLTYISFFFFF